MLHALHQRVEASRISCIGCKLRKPFAESRVQGLVLRARNRSGPFDQVFIGPERDIFHLTSAYTASGYLRA